MGELIHCLWGCKTVQLLFYIVTKGNSLAASYKVKHTLPYMISSNQTQKAMYDILDYKASGVKNCSEFRLW